MGDKHMGMKKTEEYEMLIDNIRNRNRNRNVTSVPVSVLSTAGSSLVASSDLERINNM